MDQNKISVIVPVYNAATFLERSIGSILNQTYSDLEILLIDDGSTDDSSVLCDEIARFDSRVRVIHKQNMGVSAARNDGLDLATGEYIAFVDSDDVIAPQMLETLHHLIIHHKADIAVCGYERISSQDAFRVERGNKTGAFNKLYALCDFITSQGYCGFLCNKLFRRDLFQKPTLLRLDQKIHLCEDLLMTCQLTDRANLIAYTEDKLYGYVIHRSLAERQIMTEKAMTALAAHRQLIEVYRRNGLSDADSMYAYLLAVMLTYCNSEAVKKHFRQLLVCFRECRRLFKPKLHTKKEILIFYIVSACPYVFARLFGVMRRVRGHICQKKH